MYKGHYLSEETYRYFTYKAAQNGTSFEEEIEKAIEEYHQEERKKGEVK